MVLSAGRPAPEHAGGRVRSGSSASPQTLIIDAVRRLATNERSLERRVGRPVLHRLPPRLTPQGPSSSKRLFVFAGRSPVRRGSSTPWTAANPAGSGSERSTSAMAGRWPKHRLVRPDFPGVQVHLIQAEPPDCYDGLLRGGLDLAVTSSTGSRHSRSPPASGSSTQPLTSSWQPGHEHIRWARRWSIDLVDLKDEDLIGTLLTIRPRPGGAAPGWTPSESRSRERTTRPRSSSLITGLAWPCCPNSWRQSPAQA